MPAFIKILLRFSQGRRLHLALALGLGLLSGALDQGVPYGLKVILDTPHQVNWHLFALLGCSILASALCLFAQRHLLTMHSRLVEKQWREELFHSLQGQPKTFFDHHTVGDLMSRVGNDVEKVRDMLGPGMLHLLRMGLGLIYASLALFWLSPRMALVGLSTSFLLPWISIRLRRSMQAAYRRTSERLSAMSVLVQETLGGIQAIQALGREPYFQGQFEGASSSYKAESIAVARETSLVWPAINLVSAASLCLSIGYGAHLVSLQQISLGTLAASVLFLVRVQYPLVGLGWVLSLFQRGLASLERVEELRQSMVTLKPLAPARTHFRTIELRSLSFTYSPSAPRAALQGIDLRLEPGKSLGIVGETGSGKSTLLHVLAGIESVDEGHLFLDGEDSALMSPGSYSSLFALAPQDGFLFSESIADNIALGQGPLSRSDIASCARAACLEKDLVFLPQGIHTLLGEKGVNLSGGQKQRVGLARALIANAPVLLLDDTLSAVDTRTERELLAQLFPTPPGQSLVLVSHRYTAVACCDEIIVLEQGRIRERGKHESLLALGGLYAKTWEQQQRHA